MANYSRNQRGVSVIEVMIAMSMAGIIIVSVGNTLLSVKRIGTESAHKEKAVAYARQEIERLQASVVAPADNPFSCSVVAPATSCSNDGVYFCTPIAGYSSCWPKYLKYGSSNESWYIDDTQAWHSGTETVDAVFSRSMQLTDIDPDCAATRCNIKKAVATVSWTERGATKSVTLTSVFTAWKNI